MVYGPVAPGSSKRRSGGGRRVVDGSGDPGRAGRSVVRALDRHDGAPRGDAVTRHAIHESRPEPGAPPKAKPNGHHHAVAARWLRPRAHRRDRRPRVRRARGDGRGDRDGATAGSAAERVLVSTGAITEDQLARAVAERFGLDHLDLAALPRRPRRRQARHAGGDQALPGRAGLVRRRAHAAGGDGRPGATCSPVDDIAVMTGYEVRPAVASPTDIDFVLERPGDPNWGATAPPAPVGRGGGRRVRARRGRPARRSTTWRRRPINFGARGEDASVIQLVQRVIKEAVERGASDIHFEPQEEEMRVRYRIDGVLHEAATIPSSCPRSSRGSRSSPTSTSPSGASRRTAASRSRSTASRSTSASPRCPRSTARTSSCASSTSRRR